MPYEDTAGTHPDAPSRSKVSGSPDTLSELYERLSGRVNQTFSVGEYSKKLGCVSSKTVTEHSQSIISLTCTACQVEETTQGLTLSQYTGCQLLVSQLLFRDRSSVYHKTLTNDDQGSRAQALGQRTAVSRTEYVMEGANLRPQMITTVTLPNQAKNKMNDKVT